MQPEATTIPSTRTARSTGRTRVAFVNVVLVVAATSVWWFAARGEEVAAAPARATVTSPTDEDRAAPIVATTPTAEPVPAPPPERNLAAAPDPRRVGDTDAPHLRVRLRGLRDDVPWTGIVQFEWGAQKGHVVGATTGVVSFELSRENANDVEKGWVTAHDRRYTVEESRWIGTGDREVVLDVHARARVIGVVRSPTAERPACDVFALATRDGHPTGEVLDRTNTSLGTDFSLLVPSDTPVFVAIVPTTAPTGFDMGSFRGPDALHGDVLPTSRLVTARAGADTDLGVIDLPRAEPLRGRVTFADGRPVKGVLVHVNRDTTRTIGNLTGFGDGTYSGVVWNDDGTLAPQTFDHTDRNGDFSLPAVPGAEVVVTVGEQRTDGQYRYPEPELCIVGRSWSQRTTARQFDVRLPAPIRLVATNDGKPTDGNAWFEFDTATPAAPQARVTHYANRDGTLLAVGSFRAVRARAAGRVSPWRTIDAARSEPEVVLDATQPLGELTIECPDKDVFVLHMRWSTADDHGEGDSYRRPGEAFRCFLPHGTNHLRITGGSHQMAFLLPIEVDVEIGTTPQRWSLPMRDGGLLRIAVVDDAGRHLEGTVRIARDDGTAQDVVMRVRDYQGTTLDTAAPNHLSPFGMNESKDLLPPGDYRVTVTVQGHPFDAERITITARERTEIHLRRP